MPALTDRDFTKFAQAAATDLVEGNIPLGSSVDKIASEYGMNDEQLRRLCEATNNAAFAAVFEAKGKTASEDRFVDFEIADANKILRTRMGASSEKTASVSLELDPCEYLPLAMTRRVHNAEAFEKSASDMVPAMPFDERPTDKQRRLTAGDRRKIAAAAEHLRIEKIAAEQEYGFALEALTREFRKVTKSACFDEFEKEAMAAYGVPGDAVLDHLRKDLRLPEVTRQGHAKLAAYTIVDTKTLEHGLFKTALDHWTRIRHIEQVLTGG